MRRQLISALLVTVVLIVLLGVVYPLVVTGVAEVAFSDRANGSLVKAKGKVIGSALIGQNFSDKNGNPLPQYFQPRPSAAGNNGYDPAASGASNFGPSSENLLSDCLAVPDTDASGKAKVDGQGNPVGKKNADGTPACDPSTVPRRVAAYRQLNMLAPGASVPVDAVTASGSGLDPDISVANARDQVARVAKARQADEAQVRSIVDGHVNARPWGVLGEATVNVLDLNIAMDQTFPTP